MVFRFLDPRYRRPSASPSTNGGGGPSRPFAPREAALRAELDALYAERAAVARAESEERANLVRLQDRLDILAGEIDALARRTRDPDLRERGASMVGNVKAFANREGGIGRDTPQAVVQAIKYALGLERPPVPPSPAVAAEMHQATAQQIVDAGNRAAGRNASTDVRTGEPRPLPSSVAMLDPVARGIIQQGRRAKNEKPDG
jgi:hypothetical protein